MESEGFDLDRDAVTEEAAAKPSTSTESGDGKGTAVTSSEGTAGGSSAEGADVVPVVPEDDVARGLREAAEWKAKGNEKYLAKDYEGALHFYEAALEGWSWSLRLGEPIVIFLDWPNL